MKYKVIVPFTDKYTGEFYKEGRIIEITKTRAKEILSVKEFIEEINEPTEVKKPQKNKK